MSAHLAEAKVEVPSLFIGGADDPVLVMSPPGANDEHLSDHRGNVIVDGAGHWVQQEQAALIAGRLASFVRR
jgi:pimeloyl-ACP methyl ester carboxylesterase